jgi:Sec-independent protein translocase protein TatA
MVVDSGGRIAVQLGTIAVVAWVVFGPEELPGFARRAAVVLGDLQRLRRYLGTELRDAVGDFDRPATGFGGDAPDVG